ncbi:MAG TPA: metalloregulator ArsR/SmtB family transcription factor [Micromonosporaceae bacterium]|jgi:ArsR family transcriptional regulator
MSKQLVVLDNPTNQEVCCPPIAEASLDPGQATDMARMFKALGDPIRLRLLSRITSAPDGEICVCEITGDDFNVSGPTISHHLKVLREAGLIEGERRGTWVYYRRVTANLHQLASLLAVQETAGTV